MPDNKPRAHWREDPAQLPDYFAAAHADCQQIHLEAEEWARNYYDEATDLSGAAIEALDILRREGYGDLASLLSTTARRGENLTLECAEAAKSFICQELTVTAVPKGNSKMARASKTVNRLIEGVLEANDFWSQVAAEMFDEASWHPVGVLKVAPDPVTKELKIRSVDPTMMSCSLNDGSDPESLYETMYVSRAALLGAPGWNHDAIRALQACEPPTIRGVDKGRGSNVDAGRTDTVCIVDCWTKKVGETPGRHIVLGSTGGKLTDLNMGGSGDHGLTILNPKDEQEWNHDWLPYPSFRWKSRRRSWFGQSIGKIVAPNHARLNWYVGRVVQMLEASVPRLVKHAEVNLTSPVSKGIMDTIEWTTKGGKKLPEPRIEIAGMVPQEILNRIDAEERKGFDKIRVNRDAARGEQPKGINTAPGQRAWDGTVNRAMKPYHNNWQQMAKEVGRCILGWAPIVYAEKGAIVKAPGTGLLQELPAWSTLDPTGEEKYDIEVKISSGLSQTLAVALEETAELEARGMLDRIGAARALYRRVPEVGRFVDEAAWTQDLADTIIDMARQDPPVWRTPLAVPEFVRDFLPRIRAAWGQAVNSYYTNPDGNINAANLEMLRKLLRVTEWRAATQAVAAPVTPAGPSPDAIAPTTV